MLAAWKGQKGRSVKITEYVATKLLTYPDPDAKCIVPGEGYWVETKGGKMYKIPCESALCPKHAGKARGIWAERIKYEVTRASYNWWFTLPIGPLVTRPDFSKLWQGWRRAVSYKYPDLRYCFVLEVQNLQLHMHGLISSERLINCDLLKALWCKYLKKHFGLTESKLTAQATLAYAPEAAGRYMCKADSDSKPIQLPPKGWYPRLFYASLRYGKVIK